ncbi:MAG: alpha/beta hydrolase-fold protein [Acidimicrobiia bacterium]|nr:alpha/beta hydrolase-fold protein [Acidimicrobiia bacterium]
MGRPLNELRSHPELAGIEGALALRAARALETHGNMADLTQAADLAWRAHLSGEPDASLLFATCTDRHSVIQGRAQPFGTVTMEHQGDVVLAPIDPSTPPEMRQRLGLPDADTLRARVEDYNRQRAVARAEQPGVPDGKQFCRVWREPTAAELRARWEAEGEPVWADGDELTFVCDRPLPGAIVGPLFELPMWRVEDLLVLQVRVDRLSEAVLTYGFWPLDDAGRPAFRERPEPDGRWRGPDAPPAAPSRATNDDIEGTLVTEVVESRSLGEGRKVTVYRPPGHTPDERLPVVYATDGGMFAPYARRLDAAIGEGAVPRTVVVAAHSAGFDPTRGGNVRAMEYIATFDPQRFDAHQRFFIGELSSWAEERYGVSAERDRRAVFGCSDGGAHAMAVGLLHHQRFGHVISYSGGMPPSGHERWPDGGAPFIQLCAGTLEPQFFMATQAWAGFLSMMQIEHHWTERVCGHELLQWIEELPRAIARAFG